MVHWSDADAFREFSAMQRAHKPQSEFQTSILTLLLEHTDEAGEPTWAEFNQLCLWLGHNKNAVYNNLYLREEDLISDAEAALENAYSDDLIVKYENSSVRNTPFKLSPKGQYELSGSSQLGFAEMLSSDPGSPTKTESTRPPPLPLGHAYVTDNDGAFLTTEDGAYITTKLAPPTNEELVISVSSADWTGIAERLESDPEVVSQISNHIIEIDNLVEQSGLTNLEMQRAKAITESLRLLVASPQPEWKAIATLLTSPALAAILNVAAIVQLILKLFGIG